MDALEFAEWMAYDAIEPFGEERADLRNGIACAVIASVAPTRTPREHKPSDFMPRFEKSRSAPSEEIVAQKISMFFHVMDQVGRNGSG